MVVRMFPTTIRTIALLALLLAPASVAVAGAGVQHPPRPPEIDRDPIICVAIDSWGPPPDVSIGCFNPPPENALLP